MPPADRIAWITEKIERCPPRKVEAPAAVLHAERVSAARGVIFEELTERARIEERTDAFLAGIEWPDRECLPKVVSRFLNRKRQRKKSWRRPMTLAGEKMAQRALARLDEDQMP
jgi:hypothetical protein